MLASTDPMLRQAAAWVASHHPDWGGALAGFFADRLAEKNLSESDCGELQHQLAQFARAPEIQTLIATSAQGPTAGMDKCRLLLSAMAEAGLKEAPLEWVRVIRAS